MSKDTHIYAVIVAAGSSSRMDSDIPKQYLSLSGKAILRYSIEKLIDHVPQENIYVVINPDHKKLYDEATHGLKLPDPVSGGSNRKESVFNGLNTLPAQDEDLILVHDAARPFVRSEDIQQLIETVKQSKAATLSHGVYDTIINDGSAVDRDSLTTVTTPQGFEYGLIKKAHDQFKEDDSFTDDAGLAQAYGADIEYVPSSRHNFKITTQDDLTMAQALMNGLNQTRVASGFDVHAFETAEENKESGRVLKLGGLTVEHSVALKGHSDADVVLHAITDAILGGCNLGDIGTHFPPSDPQWKDMDSAHFLTKAMQMVSKKGANLNFIDVTIMTEEPKIGPLRDKMQSHIASILSVDASQVSIKATTTEALGFVGRKEGIACQALATLSFPSDNGL